jgi:hypothetical protein
VNPSLRAVFALAKVRGGGARFARAYQCCAKADAAKTSVSSALPRCEQILFCARPRRKNFSARAVAKLAPRLRRGGGSRALHTKLSEVTVIFFLL